MKDVRKEIRVDIRYQLWDKVGKEIRIHIGNQICTQVGLQIKEDTWWTIMTSHPHFSSLYIRTE